MSTGRWELQTCPLTVTPLVIGKKCHSKGQVFYCVTVTKHLTEYIETNNSTQLVSRLSVCIPIVRGTIDEGDQDTVAALHELACTGAVDPVAAIAEMINGAIGPNDL